MVTGRGFSHIMANSRMGEGFFVKLDSLVDIDNTCGFAGYSQCILPLHGRGKQVLKSVRDRFQELALIRGRGMAANVKHRRKSNIVKNAEVLYNRNFTTGEVDRRMYGSFVEHLGRCVYNGIYQPGHPAADENGFRNDVKELIRELGVTAIRYPGGNCVSGYDWKDGIGPKEKRPVRKEMAWNVLETNEVGTDEFARFAADCGTEVLMAVNLGTGTPKEAAELVDYCNEKGTAWAAARRGNGSSAS